MKNKLLLIFVLAIFGFISACALQVIEPVENSSTVQEVTIYTFEIIETEPANIKDETDVSSSVLEESFESTVEETTESNPEEPAVECSEETTEIEKHEFTFVDLDTVMYVTEGVRVRTRPDTSGDIYAIYAYNREVHVTGQCVETGWYRIDVNGKDYYISNGYLREKQVDTVEHPHNLINRSVNNLSGFVYYTVAGRYPNRSYEEYLYSCLNDLDIAWWFPYAVAQIWQESRWNPSSTNGTDHGICQFNGRYFSGRAAHHAHFPEADIWNPYDSLYVYSYYMRDILRGAQNDIPKTLSYYMAGQWGVSYGGYVNAVMGWYNKLKVE